MKTAIQPDRGDLCGDLRSAVQLIDSAADLPTACKVVKEYFSRFDLDYLSVFFSDVDDEKETIRPYRALPSVLLDLGKRLNEVGSCPIYKESQRLLQPFDWYSIPVRKDDNFLVRRFHKEVRKLSYGRIVSVPVLVGRGIAVFSIGIPESQLRLDLKEIVVSTVCQFTVALIDRFPELQNLFEPKRLSTMQAQVLLFAIQGHSNAEISQILNLGEITVGMLIESSGTVLEARNLPQTIAKALAYGEISNCELDQLDQI